MDEGSVSSGSDMSVKGSKLNYAVDAIDLSNMKEREQWL